MECTHSETLSPKAVAHSSVIEVAESEQEPSFETTLSNSAGLGDASPASSVESSSCGCNADLEEEWKKHPINMSALTAIVEVHFRSKILQAEEIGMGAFAKIFRLDLANGTRLVARLLLPLRPFHKTECEVRSMAFVRGVSL